VIAARLPFVDVEPLGTTHVDDVTRARLFVARRRVVCVECGEDDAARLRSVHRQRQTRWDACVWRLARLGASSVRLSIELAKCDTVCQRCHMARLNRHRAPKFKNEHFVNSLFPRPQMLRCVWDCSMRVVAKVAIASGRGRNRAVDDSHETSGDR
jgi:hypothetical protein